VSDSDEVLDVQGAQDALRKALTLQYRSALQFAVAAGSIFGLEYQALGAQLWEWARAELDDVRRLVEKLAALGGDPPAEVPALAWDAEPGAAFERMIALEDETIEALHDVIEYTGREGRSEALEHLMEHVIMRKQHQVDFLLRAQRAPGG
jgi:bacterioferritin (cytochrome b1)